MGKYTFINCIIETETKDKVESTLEQDIQAIFK